MSPWARTLFIACIAMVPAMSTPAFAEASDQKFTPERGKCFEFLVAYSKQRGIAPSKLYGDVQPWNVCTHARKHGYKGPVN